MADLIHDASLRRHSRSRDTAPSADPVGPDPVVPQIHRDPSIDNRILLTEMMQKEKSISQISLIQIDRTPGRY